MEGGELKPFTPVGPQDGYQMNMMVNLELSKEQTAGMEERILKRIEEKMAKFVNDEVTKARQEDKEKYEALEKEYKEKYETLEKENKKHRVEAEKNYQALKMETQKFVKKLHEKVAEQEKQLNDFEAKLEKVQQNQNTRRMKDLVPYSTEHQELIDNYIKYDITDDIPDVHAGRAVFVYDREFIKDLNPLIPVLLQPRYTGWWENGKPNGRGTLLSSSGKWRVDGIWVDGKSTGICQVIECDSKELIQGEHKNDKPTVGAKKFKDNKLFVWKKFTDPTAFWSFNRERHDWSFVEDTTKP